MLVPTQTVPDFDLPLTIDARYQLSAQSPEHFIMAVFYRGKHCPICRDYLEQIGGRMDELAEAGIWPVAISMDSKERAAVVDKEWNTGNLPLAYSLTEEQARQWGLYISGKRDGSEEPEVFSEPGLFLIRPDLTLYFAQVQSAPFTRPTLDDVINAVKFVTEKNYPARGSLT